MVGNEYECVMKTAEAGRFIICSTSSSSRQFMEKE